VEECEAGSAQALLPLAVSAVEGARQAVSEND
jgi:hypothetical protein